MIGVNPLRTKVLITVDEVIFHGPTDSTVDPRIILQSIIVAETRFIKPLLGTTVYTDLVDAKNVLVTGTNIASLTTDVNAGRPNDRTQITLIEGDYVNSDTYLSTTQKELWNTHLHKIVAECVIYCSLVHNRARFAKLGVIKNAPNFIGGTGDVASVELFELKHLMDRTQWYRINPLIAAMHTYLCKTKYPDYDEKKYTAPKSNSINLSMYDDDDDDERRDCKYWWP